MNPNGHKFIMEVTSNHGKTTIFLDEGLSRARELVSSIALPSRRAFGIGGLYEHNTIMIPAPPISLAQAEKSSNSSAPSKKQPVQKKKPFTYSEDLARDISGQGVAEATGYRPRLVNKRRIAEMLAESASHEDEDNAAEEDTDIDDAEDEQHEETSGEEYDMEEEELAAEIERAKKKQRVFKAKKKALAMRGKGRSRPASHKGKMRMCTAVSSEEMSEDDIDEHMFKFCVA